MRAILRMRSLLSPIWSTFSPHLVKSSPLGFYLSPSQSIPCDSSTRLQIPNFFVKPSIASLMPLMASSFTQSRGFQAEASPSSPPPSGEIHVIVGPMFAGKTTTLLRRVQLESECGRNVAVIKSNKDIRYGLDSIVSHDGAKFPCCSLANLSSFRQKFGPHAYDELDVIGIDEAQFFGDLYEFCREAADCDGKTVIVAGLDGDYLRRSFGSVVDIIPLADSVTKLTARCEMCGRRAFFTLRKTSETRTELVGGAEVYMPVCRQHYISGQNVIEATRTVLEPQKVQFG